MIESYVTLEGQYDKETKAPDGAKVTNASDDIKKIGKEIAAIENDKSLTKWERTFEAWILVMSKLLPAFDTLYGEKMAQTSKDLDELNKLTKADRRVEELFQKAGDIVREGKAKGESEQQIANEVYNEIYHPKNPEDGLASAIAAVKGELDKLHEGIPGFKLDPADYNNLNSNIDTMRGLLKDHSSTSNALTHVYYHLNDGAPDKGQSSTNTNAQFKEYTDSFTEFTSQTSSLSNTEQTEVSYRGKDVQKFEGADEGLIQNYRDSQSQMVRNQITS